jgi:hypothetical protein
VEPQAGHGIHEIVHVGEELELGLVDVLGSVEEEAYLGERDDGHH